MDSNLDIASMSITDQKSLLDRDSTRIYVAERDRDAARADYKRLVTDNPNADIPEVRERLDAEVLPQLRAAEREAARLAREVEGRARRVAQATKAISRPDLTSAEMADAASHAPFVEMQTRDLKVKDLLAVVRSAVGADDRAHTYSLRMFAVKRLEVAPSERNDLREDRDAVPRQELRQLLAAIDGKLADPSFAAVQKRALHIAEQAASVARDAERPAAYDRSSRPLYPFENPGDVPWTPV